MNACFQEKIFSIFGQKFPHKFGIVGNYSYICYMEKELKTSLGTLVRENKLSDGRIVSLSMKNITLFKSDVDDLDKAINTAPLRGGNITINRFTVEYNNRSKYIHWFGLGKFKFTELQELIALGKKLINC